MLESQAEAMDVPGESGPAPDGDRRRSTRLLIACVALCGVGLIAYYFFGTSRPLSPEEAQFVGKWIWTAASGPGIPATAVNFLPDRRLHYLEIRGLEANWKVAQGRLRVTFYYPMTLYRDGPVMPMKKADASYWTILPSSQPDRIHLKLDSTGAEYVLTRQQPTQK